MSSSNSCFLPCIEVSHKAGNMVWYSHLFENIPQLIVIQTVKGFSIINEAEVDDFLECSCIFYDPVDVDNLISGSSAFSKSSLHVWKLSVHVLLKPSLKDFEHNLSSMWNEYNCTVIKTLLELPSFGIRMKTDLFQSCGHCWVFQICWPIEWITLTASSFRIWNSSAGILSPPHKLCS